MIHSCIHNYFPFIIKYLTNTKIRKFSCFSNHLSYLYFTLAKMKDNILGTNNVRLSLAQYQQTFRSHIEQQVYDTQIRQETQFGLENLIVRLRNKLCIHFPEILFRMNYFPKIGFSGSNPSYIRKCAQWWGEYQSVHRPSGRVLR